MDIEGNQETTKTTTRYISTNVRRPMKILISHRGNLNGPDPKRENTPDYIEEALYSGVACEIDVWKNGKRLFLGHEEPTHEVRPAFLKRHRLQLWCHAKNFEALDYLLHLRQQCFWHQEDDFTMTSNGYIWTHVSKSESKYLSQDHSIAVVLEWDGNRDILNHCQGVCSDYIERYRT